MLNKLPSILICILLLMLSSGIANSTEAKFQECNRNYSTGDFQAAVSCYTEIAVSSGFSAAVEYNLANAYAQLGQVGPAILHYERAVRLAPGDSDISGNLSFLRKESGLFPAEKSLSETILHFFTLEKSATLALGSMLLLTGLTLITILKKNKPANVFRTLIILFSFFTVLSLFLCWKKYQSYNPSIVIDQNSRLLISPFEGSRQLGAIDSGRMVNPIKTHGNYSYVIDETGKKGWLPSTSIAPVIP